MLSKILVSSLLFLTFLHAETISHPNYQQENRILKLKLEIFALEAKNRELQEVINRLSVQTDEHIKRDEALAREKAIAKFREELRMSRTRK